MANTPLSGIAAIADVDVTGSAIVYAVANSNSGKMSLLQIKTYIEDALSFGSAATYDVGTGGASVPLLSGANTWSVSQLFVGGFTVKSSSGAVAAEGLMVSESDGDVVIKSNNHNLGSEQTFTFKANGNFELPGTITFGSAIAVASGGTGATTAAGARTNLGIGDIAVSGAIDTSTGAIIQTGASTWVKRAVGVSAATDILDRQSADTRYTLSGAQGLPIGGTAGQALIKNTSTDYDASWTTKGFVATGGSSGQFYKKSSGTDFAAAFATLAVSDLSDYSSDQTTRHAATLASAKALAIAFAVAL